jgi:multidrug efflux pump subunit AcrB
MRVWLDPDKMAGRNLSAGDVIHTVEQQNAQVAAGQIGQPPVENQVFQYTMNTLGRLADPEQFADMILKTTPDGRITRLKDVSRIEMGALGYDQFCTLDGKPSVALSVYQLPGTNALDTARLIRERMSDLKDRFPAGLDYAIVYDTTPFITESVNEVFKSLRDAVILVAVVVLVFLQSWRSAIIPLVAVPVAVVGTFAAMAAVGFSLNNLTLFGLVLAIGIVVDDAIVVVEAVEQYIEQGYAAREAAIRAMNDVSGPVIAVGLVLTAVFVPCAFISGIVGQFYRQFALTIAISTLISAFNSLTLSPALAAILLKPHGHRRLEVLPRPGYLLVGAWVGYAFLLGPVAAWLGPKVSPWLSWVIALGGSGLVFLAAGGVLDRVLGWSFALFNRCFAAVTAGYVGSVAVMLRGSLAVLAIYGGMLYLTWHLFQATPTGFIPQQDKGYLLVNVQLPDSASLSRTERTVRKVEEIAGRTRGVRHTVAIAGQSILLGANSPNFGSVYVMLDDFHHRRHAEVSGEGIARRLREAFEEEIGEGLVNVFSAPPIEGLGNAGGFKVVLEDRADLGARTLQEVSQSVVATGSEDRQLRGLYGSFRADTPWLFLDVDRAQAKTLRVSMLELFNTLQVYFGSLYVNDFNRFGRTWQVNIQADADFRKQAEDLKRLKVRNEHGDMVPLGAIAKVRDASGPMLVTRYNLYPSALINADAAAGSSSGQATEALLRAAKGNLGPSMRAEWTELALLQSQTGNTAVFAFVLAVVLVFLVLAAQYESWALPMAVILVVPMCLLCAVGGVALARMDVNVFTQIGFVVLVGLACKNAILIVEYARARHEAGSTRYQATLEACRLRLRPIVMTSFAFILGVLPLVVAEGAGAEMRRTLGTAVFAGMLGVTLFGVFLTPVFFFVIQWLADFWPERPAEPATPPAAGPIH